MVHYPLNRFFIYNGQIKPNNAFIASENAGGIYEVLRVAGSVPLFLEEHLNRFYISARLAKITIRFTKMEIAGFLTELISRNEITEGNILLSNKEKLKAFFITHNYPEEVWYTTGVTCGVLHAERENPNAKVFQTPVRKQADELMEKEGYYEVLLVDHSGKVTEGSRSNVFFVKGNQLITPPGKEVLLGITRQKTIQLAGDMNISYLEQNVLFKNLKMYDAAFITGTSPKILPLSHINGIKFNTQNNVVQLLIEAYNKLIMQYISSHR